MTDIKKFIMGALSIYVVILLINGVLSFVRPSSDDAAPVFKARTEDRAPKKKYAGEIVRKNRVVSGMDFEESVFYAGNEEIARQKIIHGKVVETSGKIPDGKVHFIDEYRNTHGEEFYSRGRKQGPALTYYQDGKLKAESQYLLGELTYHKEFYNDGAVRMEENYEDALLFPDEPTRETGIGKVYFPDGKVKYEWSFAKSNPTNFKKSYNRNGELTLELYFDRDGYPINR